VAFNSSDKVLSNVKLRQAIGHGINRDEIIDYVLEGMAINAPAWIPAIVYKTKERYNFDYDPEKAKELLKEAGYPNGLELSYKTCEGRYLKDRQISEAVQSQLAEIGIKINLQVMEWGAYLDSLFRGESQMFIMGHAVATGEPHQALRGALHSESRFNFSRHKNPEFDSLLAKAGTVFDPKQRYEIYDEIQKLLIDTAAVVPMYHKLEFYGAWKRVKDFYPHPMELLELSETTIE